MGNGSRAAADAPLYDVLATTRLLFGGEAIEYRSATARALAPMLGIKEYPTPTVVGMYDRLLSAPFPFVLTQSFTFLTKAAGQGLLHAAVQSHGQRRRLCGLAGRGAEGWRSMR